MTRESIVAIDDAAGRGEVLVSPVSAWEIGLLVQKGRIRLDLEPLSWFERFLALPGIRLTPLSVAAAGLILFPARAVPRRSGRPSARRERAHAARHLDHA